MTKSDKKRQKRQHILRGVFFLKKIKNNAKILKGAGINY